MSRWVIPFIIMCIMGAVKVLGDPVPPWQGWNMTKLLDVLEHPWGYAAQWSVDVGGINFLTSVFAFGCVLYTWWHTKQPFPAGIVGFVLGAVLMIFPEVRFVAFLLIAFGVAIIGFKVLREVVG